MPFISSAQSDISAGIGAGFMYYNGDLSDNRILPPLKLFNFGYGAELTSMLTNRVELSVGFLHGKIMGDDALSTDRLKKIRNLSFVSTINEFSLKMRLEFYKATDFRPVNTYLLIGMDYLHFRPRAENASGNLVDLQPLGTEGQYIDAPGYPDPYSLNSLAWMAGLGARITLNPRVALLIECAPRITFTDYLDDVSTFYPDSASLSVAPLGPTAVSFSSQNITGFPKKGKVRGNPDNNDIYVYGSVTLRYYFGELYSTGTKPGIFRKIRSRKGGWWGD